LIDWCLTLLTVVVF